MRSIWMHGHGAPEMPMMETQIWGLDSAGVPSGGTMRSNPEVRLGWIGMINDIRRDLRMKDEENVKFIMEENEKIYW